MQYEKDNDTWRKLQSLLMQLRKCCNHPYLFPGAEPEFDGVSTGAITDPLFLHTPASAAFMFQSYHDCAVLCNLHMHLDADTCLFCNDVPVASLAVLSPFISVRAH